MNAKNFPLDTIKCHIILESYSYNTAEATLDWLRWSPVSMVKDNFNLPDFKMSNITFGKAQKVFLPFEYFDKIFFLINVIKSKTYIIKM